MPPIFHPDFHRWVRFKLYRLRYLSTYMVIGFLSIVLELGIYRALKSLAPELAAKSVGIVGGILFAFVMNAVFNFRISRPRMLKAFLFFAAISFLSLALNSLFRQQLAAFGFGYEAARIIASGSLFYLAYLLHRRYTFRQFKKVGVAVYAQGVVDIRGIWERIQAYSDFIHVDIVDRTYDAGAPDPAAYRMEAIKAYWPNREIQCHIMSRTPSLWLDAVLPHVDTVIVHLEVEEDVAALLGRIRKAGRRAGLSLMSGTPAAACRPFLPLMDELMLLSIAHPGKSGQSFDLSTLAKVKEINAWPERGGFQLCVDGGVNSQIVGLLQVEKVVSGSFVLGDGDPISRIMRLQTSSQFERA